MDTICKEGMFADKMVFATRFRFAETDFRFIVPKNIDSP